MSPPAARHPALAGVRAVLFDKDGTLLDFDATWGPAVIETMDALAGGDRGLATDLAELCGLDVPTMRFRPDAPFVGGYTADFAPAWAARLGVPYDEAFVSRADALFRPASLRHLSAYDDVPGTLRRLRDRGLPIGLATNDFEATARAHLAALAIDHLFDFVSGYDSGYGAKPGPGMVTAFAAAVGLPASAVALVGDSPHDILAARAAGAMPVGIARTNAAAEALGDLPSVTVADFAGLLAALGLDG